MQTNAILLENPLLTCCTRPEDICKTHFIVLISMFHRSSMFFLNNFFFIDSSFRFFLPDNFNANLLSFFSFRATTKRKCILLHRLRTRTYTHYNFYYFSLLSNLNGNILMRYYCRRKQYTFSLNISTTSTCRIDHKFRFNYIFLNSESLYRSCFE